MAKRSLSLDPQPVSKHTWYYETRSGLQMVHQVLTPQGEYIRTEQFLVPWRMIAASMRRYRPSKYK